jgi:hypothetical protein
VTQAHGEPAAVTGGSRLRDRGVEHRPHLSVPLGPEQRHRRLREPGCECEPWFAVRAGPRGLSGQGSDCKVRSDVGGLVREDGDEGGCGQQLGWRPRMICGPLTQALTAGGHRGCGRRVVHPGDHGRRLEQEPQLGVVGIERRRCAIEHLDRLREATGAAEREPEHHGCLGGGGGVRGGVDRLLQVVRPVGDPDAGIGHAEVEQQCGPVARRGWFSEGPAQERRLRLRGALLSSRAGGLDQPLDNPGIGGRLADEQVLGNSLVGVTLLRQQLSSAAVAASAFGGGELRIDSAADDRMDERQRPPGLHDPRSRQQLGRLGCLGLVEAGESRRLE